MSLVATLPEEKDARNAKADALEAKAPHCLNHTSKPKTKTKVTSLSVRSLLYSKPMPKIKLTKHRKIKAVTVTVRDLAERTIRRLDEAARYRQALRAGAKLRPEAKESPELALTDKDGQPIAQAVHRVTTNACWRPDLYLDAGKYCDNCGLYKFCKATGKRLKSSSSQPKDGNPALEHAAFRKAQQEEDEELGAVVILPDEDAEETPRKAAKVKPVVRLKIKRPLPTRPQILLRRKP